MALDSLRSSRHHLHDWDDLLFNSALGRSHLWLKRTSLIGHRPVDIHHTGRSRSQMPEKAKGIGKKMYPQFFLRPFLDVPTPVAL
jgi:hypothetical protein